MVLMVLLLSALGLPSLENGGRRSSMNSHSSSSIQVNFMQTRRPQGEEQVREKV